MPLTSTTTEQIITVDQLTNVRLITRNVCGHLLLTGQMAGHKRCGSEAAGPSRKASERQVTKSTFDKWQKEYERDHQTLSWLRCDLERDKRHVAALYCAVCKKYEDSLQSLKSFSRAWVTGSTNHKVSNVLDHAASEVHKVAMTPKRADDAKASGGSAMLSSTIGRCLATLDSGTQARMERKFDLCYVMANTTFTLRTVPLYRSRTVHGTVPDPIYTTVPHNRSVAISVIK